MRGALAHLWVWAASQGYDSMTVVDGACPAGGVDLTAHLWAEETDDVTSERHPMIRETNAGPRRNSRMVARGADRCLAFPGVGSRGTWDCARKAVDAGIPTRLYSLMHPIASAIGTVTPDTPMGIYHPPLLEER